MNSWNFLQIKNISRRTLITNSRFFLQNWPFWELKPQKIEKFKKHKKSGIIPNYDFGDFSPKIGHFKMVNES